MKNKKLLAGIMLGLTGVMAFSGCSMNGEEKGLLDSLTNNTDKIVSLVEGKFTKEDALGKINIARMNLALNNFDQCKIEVNRRSYVGIFDHVADDDYFNDDIDIYYKRVDENKKYLAMVDNNKDEIRRLIESDFSVNKHYSYWAGGNKTEIEFSDGLYSLEYLDALGVFGTFSTLDIKNICDVSFEDDVYTIILQSNNFSNLTNSIIRNNLEIKIKNNYFVYCKVKCISYACNVEKYQKDSEGNIILDEEGLPNGIVESMEMEVDETVQMEINYSYENIDFTNVENKINQLKK